MGKYFGTDGVRGIANSELTPELAFRLGRFGGAVLKENASETPKCLVARDTRISGELLGHALIAGLLSIGVDVYDLGVITTPAVSYLIQHNDAMAGVMISASHNPAADNGIKFFGANGLKLSDDEEAQIEAYLDAETDDLPRVSAEGLGRYYSFNEGVNQYLAFLKGTIAGDLSGLRIVVDAANGSAARLVETLFTDLGATVSFIGVEPDGLNINDGVGSTHPEQLAQAVVADGADAGVAFDGDADRCIAVDEKGQIVDGDRILYIAGTALKQAGKLAHDTIVATVMSNLGFHKALAAAGLSAEITAVGDRHVAAAMREHGYVLGGEQSGHIIFSEFEQTGDGLVTALQLLSIVKASGKSLSELAAPVVAYPQVLENVEVTAAGKQKAMDNPDVKAVIEQVETELAGEGRVLVRPSGTQKLLRVMVEAETDALAEQYAHRIATVIQDHYGA